MELPLNASFPTRKIDTKHLHEANDKLSPRSLKKSNCKEILRRSERLSRRSERHVLGNRLPTDTKKRKGKEVYTRTDKATILDLNTDCLLHIFSYLSSFEKIKMSRTSYPFAYINIDRLINVNKVLDLDHMKSFTLMQTEEILSKYGDNIKRIHLTGPPSIITERRIQFDPNNFKHLEELDFTSVQNIDFSTYKRIFSALNQIKVLKLVGCSINDRICSVIATLSQLEHLNLSCNNLITGEHLSKLKNLVALNLSDCQKVHANHFIDIFKATKLKILNIEKCLKFSISAVFEVFIGTQTELEQIAMDGLFPFSLLRNVGRLTNLKHMRIQLQHPDSVVTGLLIGLTQNRKNELESLEIYSSPHRLHVDDRDRILEFRNLKKLGLVHCKDPDDDYLNEIAENCSQLVEFNISSAYSVTVEGIIAIVSALKQLRHLDISWCEQFDEELVHQIVKTMKEKNSNPLTLRVFATSIERSFLITKEYKEYQKLLTLKF